MGSSPSDLFLGPPLAERACGSCVVCCKVLKIDEPDLRKAAQVLCPNCTGSGCAIYESRPEVCRSWHCAWRRVASMGEEMRPDRLGVLFHLDRQSAPRTVFENVFVVGRPVDGVEAFQTKAARQAFGMFAQGPLPVFVNAEGVNYLAWPQQPLADAILNPTTTPHQDLVGRGRAWLKTYAPIARAVAGEAAWLPTGY